MTESDSGPLGPRCPLSSEHDVMTIGDSQAFCLDDACKVMMFNPSKSLDDNLTGPMSFVDFSGWSKGGPDGPHA